MILDLILIIKRSFQVITHMILDKYVVWDKSLTPNHKECSNFLSILLNFGSGSINFTFLIMQKLFEDKNLVINYCFLNGEYSGNKTQSANPVFMRENFQLRVTKNVPNPTEPDIWSLISVLQEVKLDHMVSKLKRTYDILTLNHSH